MKLMQELLQDAYIAEDLLDESREQYFNADLKKFNDTVELLNHHLEKMMPLLKQDSFFRKSVEKLDGDKSYLDSMFNSLREFGRSLDDLHQYTNISQDKSEESDD